MNILNRKNIFSSHSIIILIIILAILIVLNLISANHFGRIDLTQNKQYSLSEATKQTLGELEDPLFIKVYFSEKLPPDLEIVRTYLSDILSEYQAYSNNLKIEFIDPAKDEKTKKQMQKLGIPQVQMQVLEKDEFKIQNGYLGMTFNYADKKEVIPVMQDISNLEYDLTSKIKRLTADKIKVVGFLTGHGEHGLYDMPFSSAETPQTNDYTSVKQALDKNFQVTTVSVEKGTPIQLIDTLVIAGPKQELTDRELYEIDQYIMRGGKVIFLLDKVDVGQGMQANTVNTGIDQLLSHYGIQVNNDLVIDANNENVAFSSGVVQFLLPYPMWPKLTDKTFDTSHPVMSKLKSISFPWVSSLSALDKENIEIRTLATTSARGSAINPPFNLDPQQNFAPQNNNKIPVIMEAKGNFTSFYTDKEIPEIEIDSEDEQVSPELPETMEKKDQTDQETQIIVLADSDFTSDAYTNRFPGNFNFFLNAVDYLTLDSNLINIRAKSLQDRPLDELDENSKLWIKIINIGLIPVLIIIIGLIKYYLRKKK